MNFNITKEESMSIKRNVVISALSLLMIGGVAQAKNSASVFVFQSTQVKVLDNSVSQSVCKSMFDNGDLTTENAKSLFQEPMSSGGNGIGVFALSKAVNINGKTETVSFYDIGFTNKNAVPEKIVRINKYCAAIGTLKKLNVN